MNKEARGEITSMQMIGTAVFLLVANYIFYNFFEVLYLKNFFRFAAAALVAICFLRRNDLLINKLLWIPFSCCILLSRGNLSINILFFSF